MKTGILWVAIAALAVTSCSKTESLDNTNTKQLIDFSAPGIGKQTKAPIDGTTYPTGVPFGTFSYMLTGDKVWATDKASAAVAMNNIEISYQTSVWKATSGGPYYWPSDAGSSLSFICYSPKTVTGVSYDLNNTDGLTITDYVNDGTTDLMYSNEIADQKKSTASGVVSPVFNHALTQVSFAAKTSSNYANAVVTIKSVKFNAIISKGTFKSNPATTATWTLDGATTENFIAYENATGQVVTDTEAKVGNALVMLPQANLGAQKQSVTVVYELSGSGVSAETITKTLDLSGEWARNAKVKYLLTIDLSEIIFEPSADAWATESAGTMN